jgi:hypothetical protein
MISRYWITKKDYYNKFIRVYHIDDDSWHDQFADTSLVFTSVFGNNLEDLSKYLALALEKRFTENPKRVLTVITCENLTNAAHFLKECVLKNLSKEKEKWLFDYVDFLNQYILRTCLDPMLINLLWQCVHKIFLNFL